MKSIKFNLVMNALRLIINMIFPIITFPYASRILLPDGIGKVSFAQAVISYFLLFTMMGIPTYGIRVCAQVRDDHEKFSKKVREIFTINLVMMTTVFLVFIVSLIFIQRLSTDKWLYIVASFSIFLNVCGMDWVFQSLEQYRYITIRSFIFKLIGLVLLFLFVRTSDDYIIYTAITVISSYGSNVLNMIHVRKLISFDVKIDYHSIIKHIKPILILFSITAASSIYLNLDTVMLGVMTNNTEVGLYSTAIKVKTLVLSLVTALGTVLLPRTAFYLANNLKNEYMKAIEKALNYVKIVAVPLSVFFMLNAHNVILLLSGGDYLEAVPAMLAIMPSVILSGFSSIIGMQIFVSTGKEKYLLIAAISGAVIDIICNLFMIPIWGAAGAALTTTLAELVVLLVEIYFGKAILFSKNIEISFKKVLVSTILGVGVWWILKNQFTQNIFISLVGNSIAFFGIYGVALLVMREKLVYFYAERVISGVKYKLKKVLS